MDPEELQSIRETLQEYEESFESLTKSLLEDLGNICRASGLSETRIEGVSKQVRKAINLGVHIQLLRQSIKVSQSQD